MSIQTRLHQLLETIRDLFDRDAEPPPQPPAYDQPVDTNDTTREQDDTATSGNSTGSTDDSVGDSSSVDGDSQPDTSSGDGVDLDIEWPPFVGSQAGPKWPNPPQNPRDTIHIELYYRADNPDGEVTCHRLSPYIKYAVLDAWADDNLDVNVSIHPDAVPEMVDGRDRFTSWIWNRDKDPAKDANLLIHQLDAQSGSAGGHAGWVTHEYFSDWNRDPHPDAPIKNVGGGDNSPSEGIALTLHELGHCLGLGHLEPYKSVRAWGHDYTPPMATGYENMDATRYAFRFHESNRRARPKVQ